MLLKLKKEKYYKKTGYWHHTLNPEIIERTKQTNLKRYGVETPLQLNKFTTTSKWERSIGSLLKEIYPNLDLKFNDRSIIPSNKSSYHLELDIFIKSLNKAIELNGEYWHKDQKRIDYKISECIKRNIKILNINYSEWYSIKGTEEERVKLLICPFIDTPNLSIKENSLTSETILNWSTLK